jgi:hypothetical protein
MVQAFLFKNGLSKKLDLLSVNSDCLFRQLSAFSYDLPDLFIYLSGGLFAVYVLALSVNWCVVGEFLAHAIFCDHCVSQVANLLKVICCSTRTLI